MRCTLCDCKDVARTCDHKDHACSAGRLLEPQMAGFDRFQKKATMIFEWRSSKYSKLGPHVFAHASHFLLGNLMS